MKKKIKNSKSFYHNRGYFVCGIMSKFERKSIENILLDLYYSGLISDTKIINENSHIKLSSRKIEYYRKYFYLTMHIIILVYYSIVFHTFLKHGEVPVYYFDMVIYFSIYATTIYANFL